MPVLVGAAVVGIGVVVGASLLAVGLMNPAKARPACSFGEPCPPPPGRSRELRGTLWKSSQGFTIEYSSFWHASQKSGDAIVLESDAGLLVVAGRKGSDYRGLFDDKLSVLKRNLNLVKSNDPARAVLNPNVGYQPGMGEDYCGNATTNSGGVVPVDTIAEAATKDGVSAFTAFVSIDCKKTNNSRKSPIAASELGIADTLLNTFRWPSETR
jgi:hypothetical protein